MITDKYGRKWFKGNLHMHTSESDGLYSLEDAIELYRSRGYDFIAVTDHWTYFAGCDACGMTVLSGDEYNVGANVREGVYHILGIGTTEKPRLKSSTATAQSIIDGIHECGGLAILAHPAWSLNTPSQITSLHSLDGTEIFNSVSREPMNCEERAYSGLIVDMLASNGLDLPLFATDDVHFYEDYDKCRSYIMVNAESNSRDDILDAIRAGKFYATQGPELYTEMRDGVLHIESSPVECISVHSDCVWSAERNYIGENITEYDYVPVERDSYLRVEARDSEGRCAWGGIIRLKSN